MFRFRFLTTAMVALFLAAPAFSQTGTSPWENAVSVLQQAFTSTIARGLSLVAIVVAGLTFAFGEGGSKRVLAGVLFGVGMAIRANAQTTQTQIGNLEQDSLSNDSDLNTEVAVLNKINAAGVLTLRTLQDSNKLLASLLEEQTILAKQQREATTNTINADIQRQASFAANMAQVTGTLTDSLQNFRIP
jgi:type IV secretory pathway VirB2 component (pilin)